MSERELTDLQAKILGMIVQFPELSDEEISKKIINPKTNKPVTRYYVNKTRKLVVTKEDSIVEPERKDIDLKIEKGIEVPEEEESKEETKEEEFEVTDDKIIDDAKDYEEEEEEEEEEDRGAEPTKLLSLSTNQIGELFNLPFNIIATRVDVKEVALTKVEKKQIGEAWKPIFDQMLPEEILKYMIGINAIVVTANIGLTKVGVYREHKKPTEKEVKKQTSTEKGSEKVVETRQEKGTGGGGLFKVIQDAGKGGAGSI